MSSSCSTCPEGFREKQTTIQGVSLCTAQCPADFTESSSSGTVRCNLTRDPDFYFELSTEEVSPWNTQALDRIRLAVQSLATETITRANTAAAPVGSCPTGWSALVGSPDMCVIDCPEGYSLFSPAAGATPQCVFNDDANYKIAAVTESKTSRIAAFNTKATEFAARVTQYNADVVGRERRVRAAEQALLVAEGTRADDPAGYQRARNSYYTLTQGDSWMTDERERVRRAYVEPEVNNYTQRIGTLLNQIQNQEAGFNTLTGTSERILSAKDNVGYIVGAFSDQLDKMNSEAEKKKREAADRKRTDLTWFDNILTWAIILLLIAFIFLIAYYAYQSSNKPDFQKTGTITIDLDKK